MLALAQQLLLLMIALQETPWVYVEAVCTGLYIRLTQNRLAHFCLSAKLFILQVMVGNQIITELLADGK